MTVPIFSSTLKLKRLLMFSVLQLMMILFGCSSSDNNSVSPDTERPGINSAGLTPLAQGAFSSTAGLSAPRFAASDTAT